MTWQCLAGVVSISKSIFFLKSVMLLAPKLFLSAIINQTQTSGKVSLFGHLRLIRVLPYGTCSEGHWTTWFKVRISTYVSNLALGPSQLDSLGLVLGPSPKFCVSQKVQLQAFIVYSCHKMTEILAWRFHSFFLSRYLHSCRYLE